MRTQPNGFSLLELLVVLAIVMVLASLAIPNIQRSKTVANETATVASLTTLNDECFLYWTEHDNYPQQLAELWPEGTTESPDFDQKVSVRTRGGYIFTYRPSPPDSDGKISSYSVTAVPVVRGVTGVRSFFTDHSGPIRVNASGEATADSPSISQSR